MFQDVDNVWADLYNHETKMTIIQEGHLGLSSDLKAQHKIAYMIASS